MAIVAGVTSAELPDYQADAEAYVATLNRLTSDAHETSVENLYSLGVRLGKAILSPTSEFESMPEAEFEALRKRMPGLMLNREGVLIAQPEPA